MSFNFGALADEINQLQEKVDIIESAALAKVKDMKVEIKAKEDLLIAAMCDAGLEPDTKIKGSQAEAVLKKKTRVGFADFEAFEKFAIRKKALYLFERRISSKAYDEMKLSLGGKPIPGLSEFEQFSVNVKRSK